MTFGMHHFQPWRPPIPKHLVNLKTRFRGYRLIAYWATAALVSPYFQKFFPAIGAVQHFFSITFFIITAPPLIEWVCIGNNFLKTDDFGVRCIHKSKVGLLTIFSDALLCGKSPVPSSDAMPVFRRYPPSTLVLVPALCPLPKTIVNLIVDFAECFSRYNKSLVVDPATDNRVELANQGILLCRFVALDDFTNLFQQRADGLLRGLDQEFSVILSDPSSMWVMTVFSSDNCNPRSAINSLITGSTFSRRNSGLSPVTIKSSA